MPKQPGRGKTGRRPSLCSRVSLRMPERGECFGRCFRVRENWQRRQVTGLYPAAGEPEQRGALPYPVSAQQKGAEEK